MVYIYFAVKLYEVIENSKQLLLVIEYANGGNINIEIIFSLDCFKKI